VTIGEWLNIAHASHFSSFVHRELEKESCEDRTKVKNEPTLLLFREEVNKVCLTVIYTIVNFEVIALKETS